MSLLTRLLAALCWMAVMAGAGGVARSGSQKPTPLFHGNWCGAGDMNRASPVDAFDAACRAHDLCYERIGRNACICDKAFLEATANLIRNPRTQENVRSKAATANSLFSAAPCIDPPRDGRNAEMP